MSYTSAAVGLATGRLCNNLQCTIKKVTTNAGFLLLLKHLLLVEIIWESWKRIKEARGVSVIKVMNFEIWPLHDAGKLQGALTLNVLVHAWLLGNIKRWKNLFKAIWCTAN